MNDLSRLGPTGGELLCEPGWAPPRPTRRGVLAGAAGLAGVGWLGPRLRAQESAPGAPHAPLKVGLVGCGGRGTGAAWQALHAEPGSVVLWAMGDVFEDRLVGAHSYLEGALAEAGESARLDVPPERRFTGFDNFQRVMDSGIDVVLLCSVPAFRPAHLDYAVSKGLHVFCEKPVAVDVPGVRQVLAAAERARTQGLSLVSGFCWRYSVRHREFMARLHGGAIGELETVYTNYYTGPIRSRAREDGWSDVDWQLRNWHHFRWLSGDHIVEQAVHSIDKQSWAFGDRPPLRAIGLGGCQTRGGPEKGDTWDNFGVVYEYEDGARAFLMARQWPNAYGENNDFFTGRAGRGTIENWTPYHALQGHDGQSWEYEGEGNDMYQQEHDDLFASIRAGEPVDDGTWMARSTLLAILGREAAYSGGAIEYERLLQSERRLGPPGIERGLVESGELLAEEAPVPGRYEFR
jgi:myo-inositol 2-dehydrogenase/D-chiro-inositol 1-dehydrogenase